jgi:hypothetical protein
MKNEKKTYLSPEIRRVKLEDKRVVAMAACNHLIGVDGGEVQGDEVVDKFGNPVLNYDPSL